MTASMLRLLRDLFGGCAAHDYLHARGRTSHSGKKRPGAPHAPRHHHTRNETLRVRSVR
jgi:hypothetical protein